MLEYIYTYIGIYVARYIRTITYIKPQLQINSTFAGVKIQTMLFPLKSISSEDFGVFRFTLPTSSSSSSSSSLLSLSFFFFFTNVRNLSVINAISEVGLRIPAQRGGARRGGV